MPEISITRSTALPGTGARAAARRPASWAVWCAATIVRTPGRVHEGQLAQVEHHAGRCRRAAPRARAPRAPARWPGRARRAGRSACARPRRGRRARRTGRRQPSGPKRYGATASSPIRAPRLRARRNAGFGDSSLRLRRRSRSRDDAAYAHADAPAAPARRRARRMHRARARPRRRPRPHAPQPLLRLRRTGAASSIASLARPPAPPRRPASATPEYGRTRPATARRVAVTFAPGYAPDPAVAQSYVTFLGQPAPRQRAVEAACLHRHARRDRRRAAAASTARWPATRPPTHTMTVPGRAGRPRAAASRPPTCIAHEYGHHIAAFRDNPPFDALDYGPKYWASYEHGLQPRPQQAAVPRQRGPPTTCATPARRGPTRTRTSRSPTCPWQFTEPADARRGAPTPPPAGTC